MSQAPHHSLAAFQYAPERITVGAVYWYCKSNRNGRYPARVAIYVAALDRLEVIKIEEHQADMALVKAQMDWSVFGASTLESAVITPDGSYHPMAQITISPETQQAAVTVRGNADAVAVGYWPAHLYNFDLISLNMAWRHLREPTADFTMGILQPVFDPALGRLIAFEGLAHVHYVGETERQGVACWHYTISGEGLQNCMGEIWVARDGRFIVDIELPIPDNPDWDDFKFLWQTTTIMTPAEWQATIEAEIRQLKG